MITVEDFTLLAGDQAQTYFAAAQGAMKRAGVAWEGCTLERTPTFWVVSGTTADGRVFEWADRLPE